MELTNVLLMSLLDYLSQRYKFRPDAKKPAKRRLPTIDDLRGRTYAVYTNTGVRVDLDRYFATKDGQRALDSVANSVARRAIK